MLSKVTPQVRDWRFADNVPTFWFGGRKALTRFFDNLSLFFPAGERFFIQSVKHYADKITDPELKKSVDLFCAQEAIHNREHQTYNERLMREQPWVKALDERTTRLLKRAKRRLKPRQQLAVTVALEHFTALMGHLVLRDERVMQGAHPEMAALWRWHAAEENEHKAVAFDVYKAIGGTFAERCFFMATSSIYFWVLVIDQQIRFMHHDRTLFSFSQWRDMLGHLFINPGGLGQLGKLAAVYYRKDFHPWQLDNSELLTPFGLQREVS